MTAPVQYDAPRAPTPAPVVVAAPVAPDATPVPVDADMIPGGGDYENPPRAASTSNMAMWGIAAVLAVGAGYFLLRKKK